MPNKEYVCLRQEDLKALEDLASQKLEKHREAPLCEAAIEARAVLSVLRWIDRNNVYLQRSPDADGQSQTQDTIDN